MIQRTNEDLRRAWEKGKEILRCPECGYTDEDRHFDSGGADPGNVFCNQCNSEIPMIRFEPPGPAS